MIDAPQQEAVLHSPTRPVASDGAGVFFRHADDEEPMTKGSPSNFAGVRAYHGTDSGISTAPISNFDESDFETTFFDIDPAVYYADPINCCLLIPDESLADTSEYWQYTSVSSYATPATMDSSVQSQHGYSVTTEDPDDDEEYEASYLVRHFAEVTSQWLDIFDVEKFFGSTVPVKARRSPLLRNSLAAVAAKHFGSLKKCSAQGSPSMSMIGQWGSRSFSRSPLDVHFDKSGSEWFYKAASFYDKAIGQMMAALQTLHFCLPSKRDSPASAAQAPQEGVTDDLLVAISVFLLYEFLDNRQTELVQYVDPNARR